MTVKPSWQKVETYLIIFMASASIWLIHFIMTNVNGLAIPPQYATIVSTVLALAGPALVGWFAKLRHDAYAQAQLPDPNPEDKTTIPQEASKAAVAVAVQPKQ